MTPFVLKHLALLTTLYSAPRRFYHDLQHIQRMIADMELAKQLPEFQTVHDYEWHALEIAIWFHDAIYNVQAQQVTKGYSETASAQLFDSLAFEDKDFYETEAVELINLLIEFTARHAEDLTQPFSIPTEHLNTNHVKIIHLMMDLDIAEMGHEYDVFRWNTQDVRAEYVNKAETNEEAVIKGNGAFLANLVKKPRLFYTDYFHELYEDQTRRNIARLLEEDRETLRLAQQRR